MAANNPILLVMKPPTVVPLTPKPKSNKPTVNKAVVAPKRKRKVELAFCPKCGSPNLLAFSDIKEKIWEKKDVVITLKCTSCKYIEEVTTLSNDVLHKAAFQALIAKYYQTVKSPNEAVLTFRYFKMEKNQYLKESDSADIYVFCQDDAGVYYRFAGESAKKILYFAVKDRKFKTVIAYQKHWKKTQHSFLNNIPAGTIVNFRQSPKVIGGIELI